MENAKKHRKKCVALTLNQKKEIIEGSGKGGSGCSLGRKFNVDDKTIRNILKEKNKILEDCSKNPDRKRTFHSVKNEELDEKVYELFTSCRSKNIPVTGIYINFLGILLNFTIFF
jgi:hypothetical protein